MLLAAVSSTTYVVLAMSHGIAVPGDDALKGCLVAATLQVNAVDGLVELCNAQIHRWRQRCVVVVKLLAKGLHHARVVLTYAHQQGCQ